MFIFRRMFWGIMLIIFGLALFVERVYGINLPLWGIFWSIVIIGLGISLIVPKDRSWRHWHEEWHGQIKEGDVVFDDANVQGTDGKNDYNIVFAKGEIDLTKLKKPSEKRRIEINTVFGRGVIKINKDLPVRIKATSAFGEARLPKGNSVAFGDTYYESSSFDSKKPFIDITANAVFGSLDILEV